uniref:Putative triabin n=1 Tax=Panstrongylus lignarius TaxID=156445 RepID=A0A224XPL7_9HEMI
MKMLIAVIIFGILAYAFAEVSPENKCHHEAMENFDSERYFGITHAYVTHSKNGRNRKFCREMTTKKQSDGTIVTTAEGYDEVKETSYYSKVYCSGTAKNVGQGEFTFDCHLLEDERKRSLPNYELYTSVIYTDYVKYAILYRCTMIGPIAVEDILVLQTDKNGDNDKVKKSLEGKGMDLATFTSRNKEYCDRIENEKKKEEGK